MRAFITIALAFLLVACGKPMSYEKVVELEKQCAARGLESKRYTEWNSVVDVVCVDKYGHNFRLEEQ